MDMEGGTRDDGMDHGLILGEHYYRTDVHRRGEMAELESVSLNSVQDCGISHSLE